MTNPHCRKPFAPAIPVLLVGCLLLLGTGCRGATELQSDTTGAKPDTTGAKPDTTDVTPDRFTHPTGTQFSKVFLSGRPYGVSTNADGLALVTRIDSSSVSPIELATQGVRPSTPVGAAPFWVAFSPSGDTAYVANHFGGSIGIVDVATNAQVAAVPILGSPLTVLVSPDGKRVYATNNGRSVFVIDPVARTIVAIIEVSDTPYGMAFHPTEPRLYVAGRDGQIVSMIDTRTNAVTGMIVVGGRPHNIVVSPDGSELYIANEAGSFDVWNLTSNTRTHALPIGPAHGMAMSPDGAQLYVSMSSTGYVAIIDRATKAIVQFIETRGRPRKIAFSARGDMALITNEAGWIDIVR